MLPSLFSVLLIVVCWLVFACECECARYLFVQKNKINNNNNKQACNCPNNLKYTTIDV